MSSLQRSFTSVGSLVLYSSVGTVIQNLQLESQRQPDQRQRCGGNTKHPIEKDLSVVIHADELLLKCRTKNILR